MAYYMHPKYMRELSDQNARRIGEDRQPFRQIGARANFGMWNEVDEDAVKQIDVIGPEMRRPLQVQFGDPAGRLGPTFGIAVFDDFLEPWNQRRCDSHPIYSTPAAPGAFPAAGNLGGAGEGRVRLADS